MLDEAAAQSQGNESASADTQESGSLESIMCLIVAVFACSLIIVLAPFMDAFGVKAISLASETSHDRAVKRAEKEIRAARAKDAIYSEARARIILNRK